MAYDMFSQMQGPQVSISLFGDAAAQGAQSGTNTPSMTQSIVQGGIKGRQQAIEMEGASQQNQIRANQIQQIPTANALQQEELARAQQLREIEALKLDVAKQTKDATILAEKMKVEAEAEKARQTVNDLKIQNQIMADIKSNDPEVKKNIIKNPDFAIYLAKNADVAEGVIGNLVQNNLLTEEEKARAYEGLKFSKAQEIDRQNREKTAASLEKISDEVRNDPELRVLTSGKSDSTIANFQIYAHGKKQITNGKLNEQAADRDLPDVPTTNYDIFDETGKHLGVFNEAKAGKLTELGNAYKVRTSVPETAATPAKKADPAQDPSVPKIMGLAELNKEAERYGVPKEAIEDVSARGKKAALSSTALTRVIEAVTPDWLSPNEVTRAIGGSYVEGVNAGNADQALDTAVQSSAAKMAADTMTVFRTGTPEEKQAIRDWSKAERVTLKESRLKEYYANKAEEVLAKVYESQYGSTVEQMLANNKIEADKRADAGAAESAFSGKTPLEAARLAKEKEALKGQYPEDIAQPQQTQEGLAKKINSIEDQLSTGLLANRNVRQLVEKIEYHPGFVGATIEMKAIAAQEASGGDYNAKSPSGVVGPMQVTKLVASQYGLNRNIPEENIKAGKLYLEDLIKMFNGSKALAYAAYNAGPTAVRYAQKLAGGSSDWNKVKSFMYDAIIKHRKAYPSTPAAKFKEVYNYPEKILMFEEAINEWRMKLPKA